MKYYPTTATDDELHASITEWVRRWACTPWRYARSCVIMRLVVHKLARKASE